MLNPMRDNNEGMYRGGGGGYSFVGYLSRLTIDHTSLKRPNTVSRQSTVAEGADSIKKLLFVPLGALRLEIKHRLQTKHCSGESG